MKPYINNLVFGIVLFLMACNSSDTTTVESQNVIPEITQEETIEVVAPKKLEVETPSVQAPKKEVPVVKVEKTVSKTTASKITEADIVKNFASWDAKLSTLETNFEQKTSYDGMEINKAKGKLYFEQKTPFLRLDNYGENGELEQTVITDKNKIVIFDSTLSPVTTLSWNDWKNNQPNSALFDFGNYAQLISKHNTKIDSQDEHLVKLILTPKESAEYTLHLVLSSKDFFPTEIAIQSDLMTTTAVLVNTKKNGKLPENIFGGFKK